VHDTHRQKRLAKNGMDVKCLIRDSKIEDSRKERVSPGTILRPRRRSSPMANSLPEGAIPSLNSAAAGIGRPGLPRSTVGWCKRMDSCLNRSTLRPLPGKRRAIRRSASGLGRTHDPEFELPDLPAPERGNVYGWS